MPDLFEQEIFSEFKYSKKSDLYAIGCIGFEMITRGRLPNEYDADGQYVGDPDAVEIVDSSDVEKGDDDDDDGDGDGVGGGNRGRSGTRAGCDINLEAVLQSENAKRERDRQISAKLIKFVAKMCEYQYEDRYDVYRAVLIARKNWSNMKPRKNRTAFF